MESWIGNANRRHIRRPGVTRCLPDGGHTVICCCCGCGGMSAAQPTKAFVKVEQVAALAAYLASDDAAQINGALLPIDGGWTAA